MQDQDPIPVPKWPFLLGDAAMLGFAYFIYYETRGPLGHWEFIACAICLAAGAALAVLPFFLDHRARLKQIDAAALGHVSEKISRLEQLAAQISSATDQWSLVQLGAEKTAVAATEITERMSTEAREFAEFMSRANDNEKATLRLEVEKLRRAEGDWLQILVHLLDHVYALHAGAARSGQPRLVEQLTQFQNACRELARRVGLVAFAPAPGDAFDAKRHQTADNDPPAASATVAEVIAPGFTYQSRLVRPAAVSVATSAPAPEVGENQLTLEATGPS